MTNSSLYPTHTIICKAPQNFKPGRFSNALQRRVPIDRWVKTHLKKAQLPLILVYHVINKYINTPSHYKDTCVLPNSVAGEEGNCQGFTMRPMVTIKQFESLMAVMGEN